MVFNTGPTSAICNKFTALFTGFVHTVSNTHTIVSHKKWFNPCVHVAQNKLTSLVRKHWLHFRLFDYIRFYHLTNLVPRLFPVRS
jgi:hypothetical protein